MKHKAPTQIARQGLGATGNGTRNPNPTPATSQYQSCGARPGLGAFVLDSLARAIDAAAGSLSRIAWTFAYRAAERRYWPKGGA